MELLIIIAIFGVIIYLIKPSSLLRDNKKEEQDK